MYKSARNQGLQSNLVDSRLFVKGGQWFYFYFVFLFKAESKTDTVFTRALFYQNSKKNTSF